MIGGTDNDYGYSVAQTYDGGFIIAGRTKSFGAKLEDLWLVKINAAGDTLWTKTYGSYGDEWGSSMQITSDSGYIIVGHTRSSGAGGSDVWLVKTNADGDTLWTKTYGGLDDDEGLSVQQTRDGGYIFTAYTKSFNSAPGDLWLLKTNATGNTEWSKTYGGGKVEVGRSVKQTKDGGYIVTGFTLSYGSGSADIWLIKTDASGDTVWTATYGGTDEERGYCVDQTTDDGYIIVGTTMSFGAGSSDVWLIKTNSSGDTLWTKTFGGSNDDAGYFVKETSDGGIIIAGRTGSFGAGSDDAWVIKTNESGETDWTNTYGGISVENAASLGETTDGGYIVSGYTASYGSGLFDLWLIRIGSDANSILPGYQINIPTDYALNQNHPNPFNPSTKITYRLRSTCHVELNVYDLSGKKVKTLINDNQSSGDHSVVFDGSDLASGIYLYQLKAGSFEQSRKMVLLR